MKEEKIMESRITVLDADITTLKVDAIVNAANSSLMGGGGVDGAIHRIAGPELKEFNKQHNGCAPGEAKLSPGFCLPSKFVISTVGPVWQGGNEGESQVLENCYKNSLLIATQHQLTSVAFPSISTGVYRYPIEDAAQIAIRTVRAYLSENQFPERVFFVCFGSKAFRIYIDILQKIK